MKTTSSFPLVLKRAALHFFLLGLLTFVSIPALVHAQGAYQPNTHTLSYLPFDVASISDLNGCQVLNSSFFSIVPGKFGNATHASGSSRAIVEGTLLCSDNKLANIIAGTASQDFTVGFWLRITQLPNPTSDCGGNGPRGCARLFTVFASNTDNQGCRKLVAIDIYFTDSGGFALGCTSAGVLPLSTTNVADGQWHSLIWAFDNTHGHYARYIDGKLDGEATVPQPSLPGPGSGTNLQWVAGAENASFMLNGDMDDLWVEDHAWTAAEVAQFFGQQVFNFTGAAQTWVVPSGVTSINIDARGAQGGPIPPLPATVGGKGGRVQTTLAVTPGETLVIYVGGSGNFAGPNMPGPGGFNGGGPGGTDPIDFNDVSAGGGGASDVRQRGNDLAHRVVVAGGGGAATCCGNGNGGDGGGTIGMIGGTSGGGSNPGGGGTQSGGGAGGTGCNGNGGNGSLGQGGVGGDGNRPGGGGGGGYYGGGGGGGCFFGAGGGGGSSYSAGTNTIQTQGFQSGDGQVIITTSLTCKVGFFKPYGQYQASPLTHRYQAWTQYPPPTPGFAVPQYFGFLPTPNFIPPGQVNPYVVCPTIVAGCALTSATAMLTSFSSLESLDPTVLNSRLIQLMLYGNNGTISLCPLNLPSCSASQPDQRVNYPDWCEFPWHNLKLAYPQVLALDKGGQADANSELYDANQGTYVSVDQYLSDYVCKNQDRVVLQLSETTTDATGNVAHPGTHYVFVTGQSGTDWSMFDPGWSSATPSGSLSSLQGHILTGFHTSDGIFRIFSLTGARAYKDISSSGNAGALAATASSPVELLVSDPQNRQLGSLNGKDVFGIPGGSYMREYPLADDTGTGTANGDLTGIKTAYVEPPISGAYQVTATGTTLGTYALTFWALAVDGTFQIGTVVGVTNVGSTSSYQLLYSPLPGSSGPVTLVATFDTTLADITNSLELGLIDNRGIAQSLSSQVNAAADAAARGDKKTARNILKAFINHINAQSSKHINGIAPQVLLSDATSLLSQI